MRAAPEPLEGGHATEADASGTAGSSRWLALPEAIETHISVLVFIGDRAYKFLKPVRTDFLDHSTRLKRRWACHEEVRVNSRFAPDVYLGVADITSEDGRILDHLIVMRRMPGDRQLSQLLDDPGTPEVLESVAEALASAHRQVPAIRREGAGDWMQTRALWQAGLDQMARFTTDLIRADALAAVDHEAHRYLLERRPLFDLRVADGHVRDGHGDLLADDIYCLPDGPRILDGLAFDEDLRISDTLADAAFLAMDLASRGHEKLGDEFLLAHARAVDDHFPPSLAYHYLAYRAFVRAKIACLAAEQGRAGKASQARDLLALTERYLRRGRVRLILVGGAPGTGKSTLARGLASACGFRLVSSDVIRKGPGGGPATRSDDAFRRGLYAPENTEAVYGSMLEQARNHLRCGYSVVLDASWSRREHRIDARRVADDCAAELVQLRCHVPPEVADQRIVERREAGQDPSDATVAIARRMRAEFDPWPEARTLVTDCPPEESVRASARIMGLEAPQPEWARALHDPTPGPARAREAGGAAASA